VKNNSVAHRKLDSYVVQGIGNFFIDKWYECCVFIRTGKFSDAVFEQAWNSSFIPG
jgi:hypothetical protein